MDLVKKMYGANFAYWLLLISRPKIPSCSWTF